MQQGFLKEKNFTDFNKMKFLTDENVAVSVVGFLRQEGFDVKDVKEELLHGSPDRKIFELAKKEDRIILTHDKDFLEIVKNYTSDFEGIILIKCKKQSPENVIATLSKLIDSEAIKKIKNSLFILNEEELVIIRK